MEISTGINIIDFVKVAFRVYWFLIIIRVILSWVQLPYNPAIRFIYEVTEPFLKVFRQLIPPIGMIDISPILALFALRFLEMLVVELLRYII